MRDMFFGYSVLEAAKAAQFEAMSCADRADLPGLFDGEFLTQAIAFITTLKGKGHRFRHARECLVGWEAKVKMKIHRARNLDHATFNYQHVITALSHNLGYVTGTCYIADDCPWLEMFRLDDSIDGAGHSQHQIGLVNQTHVRPCTDDCLMAFAFLAYFFQGIGTLPHEDQLSYIVSQHLGADTSDGPGCANDSGCRPGQGNAHHFGGLAHRLHCNRNRIAVASGHREIKAFRNGQARIAHHRRISAEAHNLCAEFLRLTPTGHDLVVYGIHRQLQHALRSEWAGNKPALDLMACRVGTHAIDFRAIHRREVRGKEINLAFGQDFTDDRPLAAHVTLGIYRMDDKGKRVAHARRISIGQIHFKFQSNSDKLRVQPQSSS